MRHGVGYRKLNKTSEHRKALFKNMLNSLIKYEQIITTLPKAKELKPQIDKVITIGKKNILSNKKRLFSKLQDKKSVTKVFDELSAPRMTPYSTCLTVLVELDTAKASVPTKGRNTNIFNDFTSFKGASQTFNHLTESSVSLH